MTQPRENTAPRPTEEVGRGDLLLLLAVGAEQGAYDFDAIRAMKGSFMVSQRGRPEWRRKYDFRPYDYGPFDASVYRARDRLITTGLLEVKPGYHEAYVVTEQGRLRARELEEQLGATDAGWLKSVGRWTTSRSFAELLREIYAEFPEFATRSIARLG